MAKTCRGAKRVPDALIETLTENIGPPESLGVGRGAQPHSGKKVLSRKPIKGCLVDDDDDVYMSAKSDKYLTVVRICTTYISIQRLCFVFVMDTYCVFCEAGTGF